MRAQYEQANRYAIYTPEGDLVGLCVWRHSKSLQMWLIMQLGRGGTIDPEYTLSADSADTPAVSLDCHGQTRKADSLGTSRAMCRTVSTTWSDGDL